MRRAIAVLACTAATLVGTSIPAGADHAGGRCDTVATPLPGYGICVVGSNSDTITEVRGDGFVTGTPGMVAVSVRIYEFDAEAFGPGELLASCQDRETLADVILGTADGRALCTTSAPWGSTGHFWCELEAQGVVGGSTCVTAFAH